MKGEKITVRPWCPFCGQNIGQPQERAERKLGELAVGRCECGAVYASDETGHNIGAAMVEALVYACNDDWDLAWSLVPEDDYLTGRLEDYDAETNQVVEGRNLDGRAVRGVLYFVRLHRDISEVAEQAGKKTASLAATSPPGAMELEPVRDPKRKKNRASKEKVKDLVEKRDIDALVDLLFDDKRTLRFLMRLLYTPDENMRWLAIDTIGKACGRYATRMPGAVSDLLHRLFAAASDSASSNWGAIETIGAVIAAQPEIFGAFTRHLLKHLKEMSTLPATLWALGTIAKRRPDLIRSLPFYNLFKLVDYRGAQILGLALRLFGNIKAKEIRPQIAKLTREQEEIVIYEDGRPLRLTIGSLATEALTKIDDSKKEENSK